MDSTVWIIFGVIVLLIVVSAVFKFKKEKRLYSEGKMIKRAPAYYENAEEFTLKHVAPEDVLKGIMTINFSEMRVKTTYDQNPLNISFASSWKASLKDSSTDEGGSVYTFQFTSWKNGNYSIPEREEGMNRLLTAVEKVFVQLDPETKVRTYPLKFKTKTSFF